MAEKIKCKFVPKPDKIIWDKTRSSRFELLLQSAECKQSVYNFIHSGIENSENNINEAVSFVTNLMVSKAVAADMSVKRTKPTTGLGNHRKKVTHPKWHDLTCHEALQRLKLTSKLLKRDPNNAWLRGKLNTERKYYKNILKKAQKTF